MTVFIVVACLAAVAVGRVPVLRMNRASIAFVGAILTVLTGGQPLHAALASIDVNTLALLFAVMVVNVNLAYSGFFRLVGYAVTRFATSPYQLLALVIAAAGVLSAVFLNDTIVLMLTPLVIEICRRRSLPAVPFLIAIAVAANIGSMATFIGNPQNILIGAASNIPFFTFTGYLAVPALAGLALAWLTVAAVFRKDLRVRRLDADTSVPPRIYRPLFVKSCVAAAVMLGAIVAGLPVTVAALTAAALLLVTRRIKPERIFGDIDWSILVFFGGLFMLTDAVRLSPEYRDLSRFVASRIIGHPGAFSASAVVISNIVSNVPAVVLVRPIIEGLAQPRLWWLLLAMATTLAGNLTLLGSVANLIVAETARKRGVEVRFGPYLAVGVPITLVTVALGTVWLVAWV
jgi:Na+/H+ antiporter NhaD/arsenite permease-like protein